MKPPQAIRPQAHPKRSKAAIHLPLALALALISCAESVKHDETLAAKGALEFARVVFIDKNDEKGYELLTDSSKRRIPLDKFKQTIASMHPRAYPSKVTAIEYEPMAGEKAIYIFLTGQNSGEQIGYRLTMEGTGDTGYKVLKIDQGVGFPSLSNQKRPFNPTLSTP